MRSKLLFIFMLFSLTGFVFAQSAGKIIGVVKDKSSGEPLPGVNVLIDGTAMGAASDGDGFYVILNVPVGAYDVRANFVGYTDVVLTGFRVNANVTTEANFFMEEAAVEGQAVIITAEKPLVEKHITQTVNLVTSEDLENIPIRGFANVVATQNSVVLQDDAIHIRGGRRDEVGYYIDGASSVDPTRNEQFLHIIQEAVEEFQVLAGGYTAELGGANSGIIRTELKTGSSQYHFSADFQTDKFAGEGSQFLNTYSYRHHNAVATLSGPLFNNKIRFFLAGENAFKGDRSVRFSKGFTLTNLIDDNPNNPDVAAGHPDSVASYAYPDGFTPQREEDLWALQGTLLFDLQPLQLRLSGSYSTRDQQINSFWETRNGSHPDTPMLNVLNDRTLDNTLDNLLLTGKLTYVLSPTSFLDASVSFFDSKRDRNDSFLGNNWLQWYDSSAVAQATNGQVQYLSRFQPKEDYEFNGFFFARNGDPRNAYLTEDQNYIGGTLNFTSQANRNHEIKFGGDIRRYTLRRFAIEPDVISTLETFGVSDIRDVPTTSWLNGGRPDNYGYDIYGNQVDADGFDADGFQIAEKGKNPVVGAVYVQDKVEYNNLIINAGLRYDYFDSDGQTLVDPLFPDIDQNIKNLTEDAWKDKPAFQFVSPRLGFSFPVNERTVFYMQYGKFVQLPELEANYAGIASYNREILSGGRSFQDPSGFGLDPIRTTSYEIGFRQQLGSVAAFDISGFYRNVRGQLQIDKIIPDPASGASPYNVIVNGDFSTTRGLELSLTLRRINRLQAQANYTLNSSEGSGSSRTTNVGALESGTERPSVINPLDFEQKHRGSVILDYRFGNNDGGSVLQNLGLNGLFTFNSGHPFTFAKSDVGQANAYDAGVNYLGDPRSRRAREAVNSSTTPWNFNFDLRLDKTFAIQKSLSATVYARVLNVFNIKNVLNVYPATGNAEDDGFVNNLNVAQRQAFFNDLGEAWLEQYKAINITNGQAYWDLLSGGTAGGPGDQTTAELFGHPRQIFFGIKFNY